MSESESEHEETNDRSASSSQPLRGNFSPLRRKKMSRKKTDSGIVEDGTSSDSNFENGTPVKHKRRNRSATPCSHSCNDDSSGNKDAPVKTASGTRQYIDQAAFSAYMIEKIRQLPVPDTLKLYINYNREM